MVGILDAITVKLSDGNLSGQGGVEVRAGVLVRREVWRRVWREGRGRDRRRMGKRVEEVVESKPGTPNWSANQLASGGRST